MKALFAYQSVIFVSLSAQWLASRMFECCKKQIPICSLRSTRVSRQPKMFLSGHLLTWCQCLSDTGQHHRSKQVYGTCTDLGRYERLLGLSSTICSRVWPMRRDLSSTIQASCWQWRVLIGEYVVAARESKSCRVAFALPCSVFVVPSPLSCYGLDRKTAELDTVIMFEAMAAAMVAEKFCAKLVVSLLLCKQPCSDSLS